MSFWTALVVIVAIVALAYLRIEKYRAIGRHGRRGRASEPDSEADRAELEREIVELKKRLAVLERIATDDRRSLAIAEEIEQLRDRQATPGQRERDAETAANARLAPRPPE